MTRYDFQEARIQLDLISLLVSFICELGQIMTICYFLDLASTLPTLKLLIHFVCELWIIPQACMTFFKSMEVIQTCVVCVLNDSLLDKL